MANLKPSSSVLRYDYIVKNFKLELDAIKERKKKEVSTQQISQRLDVTRWTEAFLDFLSRIIEAKNINMSYVVSSIDTIDHDSAFELTSDTCCTEDDGSFEEELIKRVPHSHTLLKEDNAATY